MPCTWGRLRKLRRLIASVFLETNDDMHLGKTEEIEIHRFCFFWRRIMTCTWGRPRKLRFIASVFLETNDDMHLGKTEEIEIHRFCFFGDE